MPFRPRLPFEKPDSVTSRRWWNGLLYSKHQLLVLWPVLRARIDQARRGNLPVPPVVMVVRDAYHIAQQWRYHSFALSEASAATTT